MKQITYVIMLLLGVSCFGNKPNKVLINLNLESNPITLNHIQVEKEEIKSKEMKEAKLDTVYLGAGCFWCTEAVFLENPAVKSAKVGYMGGHIKNPSYREICTGRTGHAEVAEIVWDSNELSFTKLLEIFFLTHDPTTLNRQGYDHGTQYRSSIFPTSEEQETTSKKVIQQLNERKVYERPIVTTVEPLAPFYEADNYHQNYYNENKDAMYCVRIIQPKLEKYRKYFTSKTK